MSEFRDSKGRLYKIELNVQAVRAVRTALGVDLFKLPVNRFKGLADLYDDASKLVDVVFVLVRDQAKAHGIDDAGEEFGRSLAGDTLEDMSQAFLDAVIDFFPGARQRRAMRKVLEKIRTALDQSAGEADKALDRMTVEDLRKVLRTSYSAWPGSVGSTPAHTPPTI